MGSKGNKSTTQTSQTQSYSADPRIQQSGELAMNQATGAAQTPFSMPVAPVAGFNPFQQQAFGQVQGAQGMTDPYFLAAQNYISQGASPLTGGTINQYYNPMADSVTAQLQNIFGQQNRQATSNAVQSAGGVGADRVGVTQGNLANQQTLGAGQVYSQLYQQALQAAQQQQQTSLGAGYAMGQLGPAAQAANLQATSALGGAGNQQQQLQQQQLNAPYQNILAQLAYPFQTSQFLAGITGGLAPAFGGTTSGVGTSQTTGPTPSLLNQLLGAGTAGVGLLGGAGAFGTGKGGSAGANPGVEGATGVVGGAGSQVVPTFFRRGGAAYADGGDTDDSASPPPFPYLSLPKTGASPIPSIHLPMGGGQFHNNLQGLDKGAPQQSQSSSSSGLGDVAKIASAVLPFLLAHGGAVNSYDMGRGFAEGGDTDVPYDFPPTSDIDVPYETAGKQDVSDVVDVPYETAGAKSPQSRLSMRDLWDRAKEFYPQHTGENGPLAGALKPTEEPTPTEPMTKNTAVPDIQTDIPFPQASAPPFPNGAPMPQARPMGAPGLPGSTIERAAPATREQESSGDYGNVTTTRNRQGRPQRALGAYGIMDFNLPEWSKEVYGHPVSEQEFLSNPNIQDAIYRTKMGQYIKKYGVEGAGRAWLGGEGGVGNPTARDALGTSTGDYGQRFARLVGGDEGIPERATPTAFGRTANSDMNLGDYHLGKRDQPYPDALDRDWGQKFARSPWMSLVHAGAAMAQTTGPVGSAIGKGLSAGAGSLENQRKELRTEQDFNMKADHLFQQAKIHLDKYQRETPHEANVSDYHRELLRRTKYQPVNLETVNEKGEKETVAARFNPVDGTYTDTEGKLINGKLVARQTGAESETYRAGEAYKVASQDPNYYSDPMGTLNKERAARGLKPRVPQEMGMSEDSPLADPGEGKREKGKWYLDPGTKKARQWI